MKPDHSYYFKLVTSSEELRAYFDLRASIFCREQQLFEQTDIDQIDQIAHPIVAIIRHQTL